MKDMAFVGMARNNGFSLLSEQEKHVQRLQQQKDALERRLPAAQWKQVKQAAEHTKQLKHQKWLQRKLEQEEKFAEEKERRADLAASWEKRKERLRLDAELRARRDASVAAKQADWEARKEVLQAANDTSTAASECLDDDDECTAPSLTSAPSPNEYTKDEWKQLLNVQKQLRKIDEIQRKKDEGKTINAQQAAKLLQRAALENEPVMYKHRLGTYVKPS